MIFPEADKLENWGTRYGLVALAAKRAKQLKAGANPLIETNSKNPLTIALEEIASGVIDTTISDNDLPKVELDSRVSLISSFSIDDDSDDTMVMSSTDDEEWDVFEDDDEDIEDDASEEEDDADAILAEDIVPAKKKSDDDEEIDIEDIDEESDEISIEEIVEDDEEEEIEE